MNVYFFAQPDGTADRIELMRMIRRRFESTGIVMRTNLDGTGPSNDTGVTMGDVDALIIEGTAPCPEIGYLLAFAIAQKKPTLFLIEKRQQHHSPLIYMTAKETPRHIIVGAYTKATLDSELARFSQYLDGGALPEIPSIKFTLRITPQIERYLRWRTRRTKKSKADMLREMLIDDVIPNDDSYQSFLKTGTGDDDT